MTGETVVPCHWRNSSHGGPIPLAGEIEPLDVLVGSIPFRDLIQPAYAELATSRREEADKER